MDASIEIHPPTSSRIMVDTPGSTADSSEPDRLQQPSRNAQGQASEGQPVVIVRGLSWTAPEGNIRDVVRPPEEDLFQ